MNTIIWRNEDRFTDSVQLLKLHDSLSPARNLSTLRLSLKLLHIPNFEESLAITAYDGGFNTAYADRIIRKLFEAAVDSNPYTPLTYVELTIKIAGVKGLQW